MEKQTKERRPRRSFTDEFKEQAVRLVLDEGKPVARVARELDLTESSLGVWVKQARADRSRGKSGLTTAEREELARLKKENRVLKMEREIQKTVGRDRRYLWRQKLLWRTVAFPRGAAVCLLVAVEPEKKHGPGVAADLRLVTRSCDPV